MRKSLVLVLVSLFSIASLLTSLATTAEASYSEVNLYLARVNISRINLARGEIDFELQGFEVYCGQPFTMVISEPERNGRSFGESGSAPDLAHNVHIFKSSEWPWKSVAIETGPIGINFFPFEYYQTEIVFGFNATNVGVNMWSKPSLSPYLEQEGQWEVRGWFEPTRDVSSMPSWQKVRAKYENYSFHSLIVKISHPSNFVIRMFLSTWSGLILLMAIIAAQLSVLSRRLKRSDHIAIFLGIFGLNVGQALISSQMAPPQLTVVQLLSLALPIAYLCLFCWMIRSKPWRKR